MDGTVKYGPLGEGWGEYLTMLHQWYEEGLIDSEFSTRSSEDLERMMYTDESGVWFDGFYMLNTRRQVAENENFRLVGINTPVRAEGEVAHLRQSNNYVRGYETAITLEEGDWVAAALRVTDNTGHTAWTYLDGARRTADQAEPVEFLSHETMADWVPGAAFDSGQP